MKVSMEVGDSTAVLGSNGVTFDIHDNNGVRAGRLRVGKATVEWCAKNGKMGHGKKIKLTRLAELLEELDR